MKDNQKGIVLEIVIDNDRRSDWETWESKNGDNTREEKQDDTNGFYSHFIQLLPKAWINHEPEQSNGTGHGASP